uniref:Uncharacterized protein n=1 Tax=Eptatretus burgeri TaxID=7764 RepID=A0A8C4QZR9_EPTBU
MCFVRVSCQVSFSPPPWRASLGSAWPRSAAWLRRWWAVRAFAAPRRDALVYLTSQEPGWEEGVGGCKTRKEVVEVRPPIGLRCESGMLRDSASLQEALSHPFPHPTPYPATSHSTLSLIPPFPLCPPTPPRPSALPHLFPSLWTHPPLPHVPSRPMKLPWQHYEPDGVKGMVILFHCSNQVGVYCKPETRRFVFLTDNLAFRWPEIIGNVLNEELYSPLHLPQVEMLNCLC